MDDWIRPRVSEDFGDAFVAAGFAGLIVGTALGVPALGCMCGLMAGAVLDGLLLAKAAGVEASR